MKELKGKRVLITGGARGMGRTHAFAFAGEGANIILTDIDTALLQKTTAELCEAGYEARYYQLDISDCGSCSALGRQIELELGGVDILVNNAGIVKGGSVFDLDEAEFDRIIKVNYLGQVWAVKAFVPGMVKRGFGHVVNMASLAGRFSQAGTTAYCASKHAVVGFSDALRSDLWGTGVGVTTVCPNLVNTGMFNMDVRGAGLVYKIVGISPERVSEAVVKAVKKNKAEILVPEASSHILASIRGVFGPKGINCIFGLPAVLRFSSTLGKDGTRPF